MAKFKVPIFVSVAPVQTYTKTITVEAASRKEAADLIRRHTRPLNSILSDAIDAPGWKAVGGPLGPIQPNRTTYDTYLDERHIEEWAALQPKDTQHD